MDSKIIKRVRREKNGVDALGIWKVRLELRKPMFSTLSMDLQNFRACWKCFKKCAREKGEIGVRENYVTLMSLLKNPMRSLPVELLERRHSRKSFIKIVNNRHCDNVNSFTVAAKM